MIYYSIVSSLLLKLVNNYLDLIILINASIY